MAKTELEKRFLEAAEKYHDEAYNLNVHLADNPELPGQEYESVKKIVEILESYDIPCEVGICDVPTSFIGKVKEDPSSDVNIAIITEYDALPGIGHACGHSASAAISLLSALSIKECSDLFSGNIDIIGTPDEENIGMKIPMAESGLFDKYDFAIMIHMFSDYVSNFRFLAFETYDFTFKGQTSHAAAAPWDGRNAVNGMMLMIHAFDMNRQKLREGSRVEGFIKEGGVAPNIIPDRAVCQYTFRSKNINYLRNTMLPMLFDAAKGAALATQTEVEYERFGFPFFDLKIIDSGEREIKSIFEDYGFPDTDIGDAMGSSDMGNVSYRCPAYHPGVPVSSEPIHTVEFAAAMKTPKAKKAIMDGAIIINGLIARSIENPALLKAMREEFDSK